jgi:hypothetical protein
LAAGAVSGIKLQSIDAMERVGKFHVDHQKLTKLNRIKQTHDRARFDSTIILDQWPMTSFRGPKMAPPGMAHTP